jgi:ABC-type antimicrobial peptide transport system permease subunit
LAAFGLYGVMAHAVSQRRAEIGVRLAVGAQRADVMRLILGEGLSVTAAGIAIGLLCAFTLTRVLQSLLYGVTRSDPIAFGTVLVVLFATSIIACAAPAMRACRIDPIAALRQD